MQALLVNTLTAVASKAELVGAQKPFELKQDAPVVEISEENEQSYLELLSDRIIFSRAVWTGFYAGMYSVNKKGMVPKPDKDCLGSWIMEDITDLRDFRHHLVADYFGTDMDEYEKAWYAAGDLMFKNFDTCHFKGVMEDVQAYCSGHGAENQAKEDDVDDEWSKYDFDTSLDTGAEDPKCSKKSMTKNMQANVFTLVTKTSALGANFEQEGWEDQPAEEKAYAYKQLGHTLG